MRRLPSFPTFVVSLVLLAGCASAPPAPPVTARPVDVRVLGREDAPVTMIEFTDLQCPYCARFATQTWPQLRARYVDTGRVRYVSRDLPLSFHAHALPAAVASRCAGAQGHFWDYREALFAAQSQLPEAPYDSIATRLGLDLARFDACRDDPATTDSVREDAAIAAANRITSTPTFLIGHMQDGNFVGEELRGAQPLEVFTAKLDEVLARPGPVRNRP